MDQIEKNIQIFKKIIEIYNDSYLQKELNLQKETIINIFKEILEENADRYELVISNSVAKKNLFDFDARIKSPISLYEKFIRRNDGLRINKKIGLDDIEDTTRKKDSIKKELKLFEDVIGVKIVTELSKDVENIYKILSENEKLFNDKNIEFRDLKDQPKPMKNGLDIYNIKAVFNQQYAFELQIKSKIYSAWTDMDHSLFYKEYSVTPIRDTVQVSMNNIGEILNQLEEFLYDLRISQEDYPQKAEFISMVSRFDTEFSEALKNKLSNEYNLTKIAPILKFFLDQFSEPKPLLTNITYQHLTYKPIDNDNLNYLRIRNEDFELIILETIFFNWKINYENKNISETEYDNFINDYLNILCKRISDTVIDKINPLEKDQTQIFINQKMKFLLPHSNSSKVLLHIDNYVKNYKINQLIIDESEGLHQTIEVSKYIDNISNLYALGIFMCDFDQYCDYINNSTENMQEELTQILVNIQSKSNHFQEKYGIEDLLELTKNVIENIAKKSEAINEKN
jgi:ppGpp synthetase/RelA/SpoT-type nucleotidyltranferase